ncbi:hypothetical protein [Frondihabitans australicus]|uniref:Phospholipase D-like protein n=1 Tax=Frondihabitans australicus TaxID=386892 RepID=A0A495IAI1_9MICO|nr:hypothetical protein [Frondihabitans australicus]RKR73014.1 phospholipase D-like protein [Frondihabitans australicus]
MLVDLGGWSHFVILGVVLAVFVVSLVMVWQSAGRGTVERVVWTALIVFIPVVGILAWQGNFWIGLAMKRLNRPRGNAS